MRLVPGIVCAVLLAPAASVSADPKTCGDGTGRGACPHHGGVVGDRAEPRAERPRATKRSQARKTTTRRRSPAGVICNDGTRSSSSAAGVCSRHGGIAGTITIERDAPQPTDRAPVVAPPDLPDTDSILCNDGTVATPIRRGACAGHGGFSDGSEKFERHEGPIRERAPSRSSEAVPPAPATPMAVCKDGEVSYSDDAGGICSVHGGIAQSVYWL